MGLSGRAEDRPLLQRTLRLRATRRRTVNTAQVLTPAAVVYGNTCSRHSAKPQTKTRKKLLQIKVEAI